MGDAVTPPDFGLAVAGHPDIDLACLNPPRYKQGQAPVLPGLVPFLEGQGHGHRTV